MLGRMFALAAGAAVLIGSRISQEAHDLVAVALVVAFAVARPAEASFPHSM